MSSSEHGVLKIVLELEPFVSIKNPHSPLPKRGVADFFSFLYLLLILLFHNATPLSGGGDGERRRRGDMKKEEKMGILNEENYTRLIVETEEGKKVAEVTLTDATPADGYRIRLTPKYD